MSLKKIFRVVFGRTFIVLLSVLFQALFFFLIVQKLSENIIVSYSITTVLTTIVVLIIINDKSNPSFKLAWVIPVLVFPVFGTMMYIFMKIQLDSFLFNKKLSSIIEKTRFHFKQNDKVLKELAAENIGESNIAEYMDKFGGYPVYKDTTAKYFPVGEEKFRVLKQELMKAKEFIFMEYFIIERGYMWNAILDILMQKVEEGVEVRVMYDGMCSLVLLPYSYPKTLSKLGIKCKMFSPIRPALSSIQNNRDHRKIVVIDGHTAFTGGINLADEYINKVERFGHWKDTAIMLKGEAVNSFTMMFLQNWNIDERAEDDYEEYLRYDFTEIITAENNDVSGYFMPYSDSPLDKENVGQNVYMDILYRAKKYVHIMTPYLILDNEMTTSLTYAAKRGVETIIIMPHIPDKQYAYLLARTYYPELIEAGVKIYEYTPGFIHAKVFVSDDDRAVVGSINLDYRSLFLHFECAAYCYKNSVVGDVETDFKQTLKKCQQITADDCKKYNRLKLLAGRCLRLVAPLM